MFNFLFHQPDTLKFADVSEKELQVLELIRVDRHFAEKYFNLYKKFVKNSHGALTSTTFLHFFDVDRSFVTDQLFSLTTSSREEEISFVKFVYTVWYACVMSLEDLYETSFSAFSVRNASEMEIDDLPKLCAGLYGCNEHSNWRKIRAAKKIYSELFNACVDNRGSIDFRIFRTIAIHHGTFMFPVFNVQRVIRKKAFGNRYWDSLPPDKLGPKAKHFTRDDILLMIKNHPPAVVIGMINNTGVSGSYISQEAVAMSCADDIDRRDISGKALPARPKSGLHGQTAARRVQFFSGKDIDIEEVNRRYRESLRSQMQSGEGRHSGGRDASHARSFSPQLQQWDDRIADRQQQRAREMKERQDNISGRRVDLFASKYANRKVLPIQSTPKESSFDNGWDYLAHSDDTPHRRQIRAIDAARVMSTRGDLDSRAAGEGKRAVDDNGDCRGSSPGNHGASAPPRSRHGRANAEFMPGFNTADASAMQAAYDEHLDEQIGLSNKPRRSSFEVKEFVSHVPDNQHDMYGSHCNFRQRLVKLRTPLTTREIVDVAVFLREESKQRNFPLEEVSGPLDQFVDADEREQMMRHKRMARSRPTKVSQMRRQIETEKLLPSCIEGSCPGRRRCEVGEVQPTSKRPHSAPSMRPATADMVTNVVSADTQPMEGGRYMVPTGNEADGATRCRQQLADMLLLPPDSMGRESKSDSLGDQKQCDTPMKPGGLIPAVTSQQCPTSAVLMLSNNEDSERRPSGLAKRSTSEYMLRKQARETAQVGDRIKFRLRSKICSGSRLSSAISGDKPKFKLKRHIPPPAPKSSGRRLVETGPP